MGSRDWQNTGTLSGSQYPNGGVLPDEYGSGRLSPGHAHFAAVETRPALHPFADRTDPHPAVETHHDAIRPHTLRHTLPPCRRHAKSPHTAGLSWGHTESIWCRVKASVRCQAGVRGQLASPPRDPGGASRGGGQSLLWCETSLWDPTRCCLTGCGGAERGCYSPCAHSGCVHRVHHQWDHLQGCILILPHFCGCVYYITNYLLCVFLLPKAFPPRFLANYGMVTYCPLSLLE